MNEDDEKKNGHRMIQKILKNWFNICWVVLSFFFFFFFLRNLSSKNEILNPPLYSFIDRMYSYHLILIDSFPLCYFWICIFVSHCSWSMMKYDCMKSRAFGKFLSGFNQNIIWFLFLRIIKMSILSKHNYFIFLSTRLKNLK